MSDEKLPSSPSTVSTGDTLAQSPVVDTYGQGPECEAGVCANASEKRPWLERYRFRRSEPIPDIKETDTRKLEECPNGYPRLATFMSSEQNFMLYRSFSYLHSRVLLGLQDEIVALERELDLLDDFDSKHGHPRRLQSRARDEKEAKKDPSPRSRSVILAEIRAKLVEYDEVLIKARELAAFQRPSERDYSSVRTFFWNRKPLVEKEQSFIKSKEDIVSLGSGREWAHFDGLVESLLRRLDSRLWLFMTPELRDKTNDKFIHYYSATRVERFVGIIITSIVFILLVLPVVAMYQLTSFGRKSSTFQAIGVLVVFTLLFSAAMSLLTKARRHELFAASAAYCAVLVVFISNFGASSV